METASVNTENLIISKIPQYRSRRVTVKLHHREQLIRMIEEGGITIKDSA